MNPRLVCRDIATGDTIRTRSGKIVSQQRSIESGGYGKRHSGAESLNAAQLPAFNDAIALERKPVHGVQREVMANIVTAIALVGRAVVGIVPRGGSVVAAKAAIGVGKVDAMRERVGKVGLDAVREPFIDAHLHGVVPRKAAGLRKRQRAEIGIQSRVADTHAVHDFSEVLYSVGV